jgi:hypothetical protein
MTQIIAGSEKVRNKMVQMLADGNSQQTVADKLGVARLTVCRWANRDDIKRKVEEQAAKMVEMLPDVVRIKQNVIKAGVRESEKIGNGLDGDKAIVEMAVKAGDKIEQSVGLAPSHAPSIIIGAIYNDNSQNVVLPQVQGLLDRLNTIDISNPLDGPMGDSDVLQSDSE